MLYFWSVANAEGVLFTTKEVSMSETQAQELSDILATNFPRKHGYTVTMFCSEGKYTMTKVN